MRRWLFGIVTLLLTIAIGAAVVMTPGGATAQVAPLTPPLPGQPPPDAPPPPPPPSDPPSDEPAPAPAPEPAPAPSYPPLPADSGQGRRIVYSVSEQRVWLVEANEQPSASWLVSGRRGIPKPGTYHVFSRSRWSSASGGRVRMEYMVRFVKTKRLAIGFHAIPVDRNGRPIQSEDELGQPRSRGCVRQRHADAEHLWNWAPDGTTVNVTR